MTAAGVPSIDVAQAAQRLDADGGAVLLDVRERDEFADVRAPDAVLLPMSELASRVSDVPDGELLVICHSGSRSLAVANYLRNLGRDATNVAGGMVAWQRAGLPVRTGTPEPGEGELKAP